MLREAERRRMMGSRERENRETGKIERKEERKKELGRNEGRKRDDAICKIGYDMILMTDNIVISFFLIHFFLLFKQEK